jgi:hypothetical protein
MGMARLEKHATPIRRPVRSVPKRFSLTLPAIAEGRRSEVGGQRSEVRGQRFRVENMGYTIGSING